MGLGLGSGLGLGARGSGLRARAGGASGEERWTGRRGGKEVGREVETERRDGEKRREGKAAVARGSGPVCAPLVRGWG